MVAKNAYSAAAQEITELFSDYLSGVDERPALVISANDASLGDEGKNALGKSFSALGFADEACTFASLSSSDSPERIDIDPQALFLLVEGLDPLFVICTDEQATSQLAAAYRTTFQLDCAERAFGRPAVMFEDLKSLLASERGKRLTWELLKTLPRK